MLYYTRSMLLCCVIHYTKLYTLYIYCCMCSVIQFIKQFFLICFVLHDICYLLCILYIVYVSVGLDQRCLIGAKVLE